MRNLAVILLLFSLAACASAGYQAQQQAAAQTPGARYDFEGNTVRYTDKDLEVEASYLSPPQADLYFSLFRDGAYKNPFPPSFFVFQVNLINRGKKNATYNPGMTYLIPGGGRPSPPKDYTDFYSDLQLAGADDADERMEAFKASALTNAITIRPGEKAQGLIVFSLEDKKQDSAVLVLNNIYIGSASRTVPIEFKGTLTGR